MYEQIADFDYSIRKHHETARRSEQRFALLQGFEQPEAANVSPKPSRLSALLRRIAGSPAAA
jgi:hypothetical protein